MNKLYGNVDYNNLKFEYVGSTEDVSFYEYKNSKELFNVIRDNQIGFSEGNNTQNYFLKKTLEQEKIINNLERFYASRQEVINFFRAYSEIFPDANCRAKQNKTKGTGLKILTPKQMLPILPIALAQVKASNNSENLLNEIRQIIYSSYQSKEITKEVYSNLIKSL